MLYIGIYFLSFFSLLCADADISRVFLKQNNGVCLFRNVYDPHHYFRRYTVSGTPFHVSGSVASEEVYDYVIMLQKRFSKLPQIPIIVRKIASGYFTHCCFDDPNDCSICYFDVTIDDMPLDIHRKFFLGHELGHFAYAKEYRFYARTNRIDRWFIENWVQPGTIYSLLIADLLGGIYIGSGAWHTENCSWLVGGFLGLAAFSMLVRLWGYSLSGPCHEEELYCDMFSLRTAKSDEERHAMVQEAKCCFGGDSKVVLVWDMVKSIIIASTHPSSWWRIKKLEEEVVDTD